MAAQTDGDSTPPWTFQDVHQWAMEQFPTEYSQLPAVDTLHFQTHRRKVARGYWGGTLTLAPLELLIGQFDEETKIYAYWDNNSQKPYYRRGKQIKFRSYVERYFIANKIPFEPCRYLPTKPAWCDEWYISMVNCVVTFYFLAKGCASSIRPGGLDLELFKWCCGAAARTVANSCNLDCPKRDDAVQKRLRSQLDEVVRRRIASNNSAEHESQPTSPQTRPETSPAKEQHCSKVRCPETCNQERAEPTVKRKAPAAHEGRPDTNESETRKGVHMSLMKEYLEAQEQERKKPDDSLRRVTAERDALSRQLQQLKTDYAEGKKKWEEDKKWRAIYRVREEKALKERDNLQKKFDSYHELWVQARKKIAVQANDIKAKDAEISKINGLRSEAEKRGVDLGKDLNEAKQKLNDAEKIHATRQEQMEKKLSKAKELWTYHKELIELHFKKEADDVKNPIMEAFEKEFEMFKPDE